MEAPFRPNGPLLPSSPARFLSASSALHFPHSDWLPLNADNSYLENYLFQVRADLELEQQRVNLLNSPSTRGMAASQCFGRTVPC